MEKNKKHYLLFIIIFIGISFLGYKFYNDYQINKVSDNDYSNYDSFMLSVYDIKPDLFKFDTDGTAVIKMDDLIDGVTNGKDSTSLGIIPLTKEQDECVGYIIAKEQNDGLKFDYTHICDMVDY